MSEVTIIGLDRAKRLFQLHAAKSDGAVISRKKLTRVQPLWFLGEQPRSIVTMKGLRDGPWEVPCGRNRKKDG